MATDTKAKPYGDVEYADPKNGKYPINSADRARAAWSYINMPKNAAQYPMNGVTLSEVKNAIKAACKKFGVDVSDSDNDAGAARADLFRSYPLEDAHIVTRAEGDGSGRLVEAYCAVFDEAAEIRDDEGHYEEEIDRAAFNKRIADVQRSRSGFGLVKVMYNHSMTVHATPSERFSVPCAVTRHLSAESRGLLSGRPIYSVYIPMGTARDWTLFFCVPGEKPGSSLRIADRVESFDSAWNGRLPVTIS